MQLLSEISEKNATDNILSIYNDIKNVTGFPLVNLIFRSMATVDGCLEWSWTTLRPLYVNNAIKKSIDKFFLENRIENTFHNLDLNILSGKDKELLKNTLYIYYKLNPINLVGLFTLKNLLNEKTQKTRKALPKKFKNKKISNQAKILPIIDIEETNEKSKELLILLSKQLSNKEPLVIPSLFRHLSPWPDILESLIPLTSNSIKTDQFENQTIMLKKYCWDISERFKNEIDLYEYSETSKEIESKIYLLCSQFPNNMCIMTLIAHLLRNKINIYRCLCITIY